ncbi:MAG: 16S rRNA processing protein RimM [Ruminococcaceae bacterium]|nr:16S rRNA processing protein RimM [Oscillospiraceae bacterium]
MELIEIGQVVNTHGIRGEFKLNPWTDSLDALTDIKAFYYKDGDNTISLQVERLRIHKNCAIIQAENVYTVEKAEALRGRVLYVEREENLPEGRYYIADLIGLRVLFEQEEIGKITDVFSTGANDVYEVHGAGKPIYLPAISQVILEINIQGGYVRVQIPDGLLD